MGCEVRVSEDEARVKMWVWGESGVMEDLYVEGGQGEWERGSEFCILHWGVALGTDQHSSCASWQTSCLCPLSSLPPCAMS